MTKEQVNKKYRGKYNFYSFNYSIMDYIKQAQDFLDETNTTLTLEFKEYNTYFPKDKEKRNIWNVTLENKCHRYTFTFWDSIHNTKSIKDIPEWRTKKFLSHIERIWDNILDVDSYADKASFMWYGYSINPSLVKYLLLKHRQTPTSYDILAGLTQVHENNFEDRCSSYWYNTDSISAKKIYDACIEQDINLRKLFDRSQLEKLSEIC